MPEAHPGHPAPVVPPQDAVPLLELRAVSKRFNAQRALLKDAHLTVHAGERVALLGPSGAGKSTLLNLACGLDMVDSGCVLLAGQRLSDLDDAALSRLRAREVGFVFQAFHLVPYLQLWQNVALALVIQGRPTREARSRARDMLERVGLQGRESAYPQELSGGEQQRVALARALVHQPRLILADEPTGNLDPHTAASALALIEERVREQGAALLMVTHSEQAAALADRCVRLDGLGHLA